MSKAPKNIIPPLFSVPSLAYDAVTLSAALESGAVTASDVVAGSLARIAAGNEALGAFVHVDAEYAQAAARASDERIATGARLGPLDGIPVSVKDNLWVSGMPANWGSRMWADFIPPADDIVVERLKAAGAVIIGKTNTPEFAFSGRTDSPLHGPARNPWDKTLTPGGSSGGAVACVAAGMTPFAIGTDAGGSTRLPASYTGLFGLRPSNGRIPRRYGFPPIALDCQAIGLFARTLTDLEMLYNAVSGPDPRDRSSQSRDLEPISPSAGKPIRIGWFNSHGAEAVDTEVAAAVHECAELLSRAGYEVVKCEAPYDITAIREIWTAVTSAGVARAAGIHPDRWADEASGPIATAARRGFAMNATEFVIALDRLAKFRQDVADAWGAVDVFLCPSAAAPAWPLDDIFPVEVGHKPGHTFVQSTFATWVNAIGHPGLSIPVRPHADGRPLGIQLVGRMGGEGLIFDVTHSLVAAATWILPDFPDIAL